MAAFRDSYSKLYELRSLSPDVPVIALTATATKLTKETIVNLLHMKNIHEIKETANKLNIAYSVKYLDKDTELECCFDWLADELNVKNVKAQRTIIYCQTIRQCAFRYGNLKAMMGDDTFMGDCRKDALIEMLHSCTPQTNKENILHSFQLETGTIRLLIATIAFGMGVNCKGVHRVIHFGPSKTVESYVQETGRAGRDGKQSVAYLLYNGVMLSHVDSQMKQFIETTEFRRKNLLMYFEDNTDAPEEIHLCCNNCAAKYESGVPHITSYPDSTLDDSTGTLTSSTKRQVSQEQVDTVKKELTKYHKSIIIQLVGSSANGNIKTLTDPEFMLRFSVQQISQVLNYLNKIFSMQDIYKFVEIWDRKHAVFIHSGIANVFGDVDHNSAVQNLHVFDDPGDVEFNEDLLDEWHDILQDDEMYEMVIENLSLSQMQNSTVENESDLGTDEIPAAILSTVQNMALHSL